MEMQRSLPCRYTYSSAMLAQQDALPAPSELMFRQAHHPQGEMQ